MRERRHIYPLLTVLLLAAFFQSSYAQPGFKVDIKKEKPYEERKLKAEKTGDGELKAPKRFFQNLTTRYNYYFNANNRLIEIVDHAKAQHIDDYSELLPFYNFSLDQTAADSALLDSVIYKCRTGIINHDLRNEWIDELYLIWATCWHLQKKLDSAAMMLQFINYAYAPQDEYGFYTYIGSRKDGAKEMSIATKEDKKFLHSNTFSRNNSFIWQIRTLTELGRFATAGSLITTLKHDPVFPKRLQDQLDEVEAYWYYKQQQWDSAAHYLIQAIDGAPTKKEKARWQYLAAQLLERAGKTAEAVQLYTKAISTTNDPILEVYARLNLVRMNKEGGDKAIDQNVAELLKMAKKDKYEEYRDVIYNMAAQMELERNNIAAAQELLMKGAKYNNGNQASRNKAFLQIADIAYTQKKYELAASFYDSIQVTELPQLDAQRVNQRKPALQIVTRNIQVVKRQDSLQRIAAMPPEERDEYIKDVVKRVRKQQGLKDDGGPTGGSQLPTTQANDMFNASKGEWYFNSNDSRTRGAAEFKQIWGNRPNADNWRRFATVSQQIGNRNQVNANDLKLQNSPANITPAGDLSYEGLLAKVPTTPEAMQVSNDSIRNALLTLGSTYLNELEDYPSAIETYEELRRRFPTSPRMDEVLFNLGYAYSKTGNAGQAAQTRKQLEEKYPSSRYTTILKTGRDPQAKTSESPEATKAYENVYNLFIEGRFDEAIAAKKEADSTYKTTTWQPQLLYIEAVYNIKQRQDSAAVFGLRTIIRQNNHKALTEKAETLLRVLSRRQQIEDELNRYQIQNHPEDTVATIAAVTPAPPVTKQQPTVNRDTASVKPPVQKPITADTVAKKPVAPPADTVVKKPEEKPAVDTMVKKTIVKPEETQAKKPPVQKPLTAETKPPVVPVVPKSNSIYSYAPDVAHSAVMIMDKVDPVFVNEAKNAFHRYNIEKYFKQPLDAQILPLTNEVKLLVISGFPTAQAAVDYAQRARSLAPTEIIPWLKGNKYTFTIISAPNLEILKGTTDINAYQKFLEQHLPGKL